MNILRTRFRIAGYAALVFAVLAPLAAQPPPATFTAEVSRTSSDKVTVDFTHHPIRHTNFQVLLVEADGSLTTHTPLAPRTYLGAVQGHPGAIACGWLRPDGTLFARVAFEDGVEWTSTGGNASVRGNTTWQPAWPTTVVPADGAGGVVYATETGVDLTYRQLVASGGTPDLAVGMAEYAVMSTNYIFLRDAAILHRIGRLVIRMAEGNDPYQAPASVTTSTLLNEVKNQWNNVLAVGTTHQVALVAHPSVNGGLAWVGVIGTSANRYSSNDSASNGDFSVVWRHEVGHNWGSNHYEGGGRPEGPTIMSDNSLPRFSSSELVKIIAHRNSRLGILESIPNYSFPLPPRANMDRAWITPGSTTPIDVLANDSDSNGDGISLLSFDAACSRGGTLSRLTGAGPDGRDLLGYAPHPEFQNGTAFFRYRISDANGHTATGYVMLRPDEETFTPLHHWALDETTGTTAFNATPGPDGTHINNPSVGESGATAVTGRCVTYNGSNQSTTISALGLTGNSYTFTAWVRRNGSQSNNTPVIYTRNSNSSNDSYTGLYLSSNQLRVRWNGLLFTPSPALSVPNNEWCLAAFSVSPTQVAVHLRTASSLTTSTHNSTIAAASFPNPFLLARSQPLTGSPLYFGGSLDDVRIFPGVLSAAQIGALYSQAASPPDFAIVNPEAGQAVNPAGTRFIAGSTQSVELLGAVEFYDDSSSYSFGTVSAPPFALTVAALDPGPQVLGARAAYGDWGYRIEAAPVSFLVVENDRPVVTLTSSGQPSFGGPGTRFVFRRASSQGTLEVPFTLSGTAVRDADFTLPGNSVVFANGQNEVAIQLTPAAAPSSPGEKSVTLAISQTTDFVIESPSSATVVFADSIRSIAGGNWSQAFVWSDGQPAPTTGTQDGGPDYIIMGGHVIRSFDETNNSQGMVARSLRVSNTGRLELARTHAATLQNVTYNIPRVSLDTGGTLRFVATTGSSGHEVPAPIEAIGNASIQFSGGSYDQFANLSGPISGTGNLTLQSLSNSHWINANVRTFSILSAGNPYSGNWSIEHTPSGDDFGALRAAAVNALGSGGVTVLRRSRLINAQSGGLDSLAFITLEGQTSSLLLNQPTQAPNAALTLSNSSAEVVVGNAASTVGSLTGTAGSIRGSGANSLLALRQTQNGSFAGSIGQNLRLRKLGSARLELTGPIDIGTTLDLAEGRFSPGSTPRSIAQIAQSGGTLELPGAASPSTPLLTVTGAAAFTGGKIEIAFSSTPQLGVPYQIVSYGSLGGVPEITLSHPGPENLIASVQPGAGSNSVVTAVFEVRPVVFYSLTLIADPPDGGTVTGAGTYEEETVTPLTATPATGWSFLGWSGEGAAEPTAASTTVLMNDDRVLTAQFRYDTPPSVTLTASGSANILGGESGVFTISRDSTLGHATILLETGGTAVPGIDYAPLPDSIIIPHGETSVTLSADALATATEGRQITLSLVDGGFYQVGDPASATVDIIRRIVSVANAAWSQPATWNHSQAAPSTGIQGTGENYYIRSHTVTSNDTASNSQAFIGSGIRVENGGILDLARLHSFTIQNVSYNLPPVTIDPGGTIRFRASVGSSAHTVAANLDFGGATTLRINGGAYANNATLTGILAGSGNLQVISDSNAGSTAADLRQITVAGASNPYTGDWSVAHTPAGDDFAALRATAANALGTGTVTVGRRARLVNAAADGIDSIAAVLLAGEEARLELQHPWNNPAAALVLTGTQSVASLGSAASVIGNLSGTAGTIQGAGALLTFHQSTDAVLASTVGPGLSLVKAGPAALTLSGNNSHSDGTTLTLGQIHVTSDTAFGTGPVEFQHSASSPIITRANLVDVTIGNDIILNTNAVTGFRGPINTAAGNALSVVSGSVTVQVNVGNGGHFSSLDGGVLRLTGSLLTTGPIPNLRSGIIEMATTGGNLTQLSQGEGTIRLAANNGIQPTVHLNLAVSASGTLDLNGFNQTLAQLRRHTTHAATVTNTAATPSVLTIDGTGDHNFSGTIIDGDGGISLVKNGPATFTLPGIHDYSGDTTIAAGTLALDAPFLADGSSLHITSGATLDLGHTATDTIAALIIDGIARPVGIYTAQNSTFITGNGALQVTTGPPPASAYDDWLTAAGLNPGAPGTGPGENADGSGVPNLLQFALGGNPNDASDNGTRIVFDAGDGVIGGPFVMTIAVREGASFAGSPSPTASIDGVAISVAGSLDLTVWGAEVEELSPAFDANGTVTPPPGYQLRSFRLAAPAPGSIQGFLRIEATSTIEN